MSNNTNAKVTVESVAAQAVEEKLVVPTQPEGEKMDATEATTHEAPEVEVVEGGKKTLKERLALVNDQLKKNKKALIAVGAAAAVAAVAFAKYAAKAAEKIELEDMSPEDEDELKAAKAESEQLADNA